MAVMKQISISEKEKMNRNCLAFPVYTVTVVGRARLLYEYLHACISIFNSFYFHLSTLLTKNISTS